MPNKKKQTKRKAAAKKAAPKRKVVRKQAASKKSSVARKKPSPKKKRVPATRRGVETVVLLSGEPQARRGRQAGDLQGLSSHAAADSESVEELLEEGNAREADVLQGVEDAPDADEGEVRTKEVPEDDVPEEYLDHE
jgi:hypothetical protein